MNDRFTRSFGSQLKPSETSILKPHEHVRFTSTRSAHTEGTRGDRMESDGTAVDDVFMLSDEVTHFWRRFTHSYDALRFLTKFHTF